MSFRSSQTSSCSGACWYTGTLGGVLLLSSQYMARDRASRSFTTMNATPVSYQQAIRFIQDSVWALQGDKDTETLSCNYSSTNYFLCRRVMRTLKTTAFRTRILRPSMMRDRKFTFSSANTTMKGSHISAGGLHMTGATAGEVSQ
ncbi:hypothetical protein CRUP_037474 [Coryphaenoides rupestris]|nr:hypothetical protein CRUP_037474 [Coryphaenoides rupestris]